MPETGAGHQMALTPPPPRHHDEGNHLPMPPGKRFHVFLSHNHGAKNAHGETNHDLVRKIRDELNKRGVITWFDEDHAMERILDMMRKGVDESCITLVFVTNEYIDKVRGARSDYCQMEFSFAIATKQPMIAVVTDEAVAPTPTAWKGDLGIRFASTIVHRMCEREPDGRKVDHLVANIREKLHAMQHKSFEELPEGAL